MIYQLVIQFPIVSDEDYNKLIEVEDSFEDYLPSDHIVDGHDYGSGQMNIFILSDDPISAFYEAKELIDFSETPSFIAAYRKIDEDQYFVIWPKNNKKDFVVI